MPYKYVFLDTTEITKEIDEITGKENNNKTAKNLPLGVEAHISYNKKDGTCLIHTNTLIPGLDLAGENMELQPNVNKAILEA